MWKALWATFGKMNQDIDFADPQALLVACTAGTHPRFRASSLELLSDLVKSSLIGTPGAIIPFYSVYAAVNAPLKAFTRALTRSAPAVSR
jgi:hypothetical protein